MLFWVQKACYRHNNHMLAQILMSKGLTLINYCETAYVASIEKANLMISHRVYVVQRLLADTETNRTKQQGRNILNHEG